MSGAPRVLLVDDDDLLLEAMARQLGAAGFTVLRAHDGKAAIDVLSTVRVEAVVVDLDMSPVGGWPVIQHGASLSAPPRMILASAYADVPTTVQAMRAGAADVITKPYSGAQLATRISELLGESTPAPRQAVPRPADDHSCKILGNAPSIRLVRDQIRNVARFSDLSVLVVGETGTGKELVAESIHALSTPDHPFVAVNCAAIPEALFESQLFGHEAGSFTGAKGAHIGLLEAAGRGVLFLDEIGELPLTLQPKLLRALESRRFRRIGGARDLELKARIITATNREVLGDRSTLRPELYYRLAGFTLALPSLAERASDIDVLATHFVEQFCARYGTLKRLTPRALDALHVHDWPGNVRELRSVVEHAAVVSHGPAVGVDEITTAIQTRCQARAGTSGNYPKQPPVTDPQAGGALLKDLERDVVLEAFQATGSISEAARRLGIARSTLRDKLRRYGLR